jgi:hypothetical protein
MNQQLFINLPQIYSMQFNDPTITRTSKSAQQCLFENQSQSRTSRMLQSESPFNLNLREQIRKIF